ncbi:hypothetical protein TYRP_020580 [Tyrophagus putrescentiae]|nr:hypothetical protein TYRP_020580 [Tyrophagus putrescentiae]
MTPSKSPLISIVFLFLQFLKFQLCTSYNRIVIIVNDFRSSATTQLHQRLPIDDDNYLDDCPGLLQTSRKQSFFGWRKQSSSAGNAWSELVSSQREAERYRITWAAVFIFILCAIAAIFHVYQAD